jgi:hypothetical protein
MRCEIRGAKVLRPPACKALRLIAACKESQFFGCGFTQGFEPRRGEAKRLLPDGHLRVYLRLSGLKRLEHRAAYTLGVRLKTPEGESYVRAYRATYLDDWQEKEDGYTGTLVFYLDLSGKPVDPKGPLEVVFLTESEKDCLYAFTVDLGAFY